MEKMKDLDFTTMQEMNDDLWEKHSHWGTLTSDRGKDQVLWMVEEVGEVISIIKKCGHENIMENKSVKEDFVEEMCDILCYYNGIIKAFNITPEELSESYYKKYKKNMNRDFEGEYKEKFHL